MHFSLALSCTMTTEIPRRSELPQLMPYHVFRDINGNMPTAVMHCNGMSNHLREHR